MHPTLRALLDIVVVLAACALFVYIVLLFGQFITGRPVAGAWAQFVAFVRDSRIFVAAALGAVFMLLWLKGRTLF